MQLRKLGNSDIKVSEISLGCWTMGGLNWVNGTPNGWANVDERNLKCLLISAIDHGVNHFDNADVYGNGRAERMLARILGNRTNNFVIATKIGWFPGTAEHAFEPKHIRHQCEQSLINLKREYIDLYYFHHGDFGANDKYLDDAVEVMYKLRDEGKIRIIGQSAYKHDDFVKLIPIVKPEVLQSRSNAIDEGVLQDNSPTRSLMEKNNISFVAFGPIAQGLLLGKYHQGNPPQFEPRGAIALTRKDLKSENLAKLEPKIEKLKNKFGPSNQELSRAALQYLLYYKQVGSVIPGFRNLDQVKSNLSGIDNPLTKEEFDFIKKIFAE